MNCRLYPSHNELLLSPHTCYRGKREKEAIYRLRGRGGNSLRPPSPRMGCNEKGCLLACRLVVEANDSGGEGLCLDQLQIPPVLDVLKEWFPTT
jgi:hypothetical protein